ncbi:MAG TPA: hypothetical protein PKY12_13260 [Catalimonadaceae bacterium]|jgi:anti-anti-sigma regulatory factor|nr:hypothetical protein [Catalimonadaceae bacterium]
MKSIDIHILFGSDLRFRTTADRMLEQLKEVLQAADEVEINFQSVSFMSRAFADQFVKGINLLKSEKGKAVIFANVSYSVLQMMESVQKTQTNRMVPESKIRNYHFASVEDMRDFMFSW